MSSSSSLSKADLGIRPTVAFEQNHANRAPTAFESFARRLVFAQWQALRGPGLLVHEPGQCTLLGHGKQQPIDVANWHATPGADDWVHLHIHRFAFYPMCVAQGHLGACDAYVRGWWDTPDLTALIQAFARDLDTADAMEQGLAWLAGMAFKIGHWLKPNTVTGSKKNILAHYDLGNDFFEAFLDPTMAYSCALFDHIDQPLVNAQTNKFEAICQQADLQPGQHVLEIGTGWGGLAIHMAKHHGCQVTTTTISDAQHAEAKQRIEAAGLSEQITLLQSDYRELQGTFDRVVSVEMVEAVGHPHHPAYFKAIADRLKPDGLACIQAITIADQRYDLARKQVDFIKRCIFPGSCIPSTTRLLQAATQASDLTLLSMTDHSAHYAETLKRWRLQLHDHQPELMAKGYEASLFRLWDMYLCYCEAGYRQRTIGLAHLTFRKPGHRAEIPQQHV